MKFDSDWLILWILIAALIAAMLITLIWSGDSSLHGYGLFENYPPGPLSTG